MPRGVALLAYLMNMSKCQFIKLDKTRCNAEAIKCDVFCFWHSEKAREKREKAISDGGQSPKRNYGREEEIKLVTSQDVLKLIEQTINDLRRNKTSTRIANAIGYLSGIALKVTQEESNVSIQAGYEKKEEVGEDREHMIARAQKALDAITHQGKYAPRQRKGVVLKSGSDIN